MLLPTKPSNQLRVHMRAWIVSSSILLLYLFKTREPILKADYDATVVIGMLETSQVILARSPNLLFIFFNNQGHQNFQSKKFLVLPNRDQVETFHNCYFLGN